MPLPLLLSAERTCRSSRSELPSCPENGVWALDSRGLPSRPQDGPGYDPCSPFRPARTWAGVRRSELPSRLENGR